MAWDAKAASSLLVSPATRSALLLGFGGGTVARQLRALHPDAKLVGVEIDPSVVALASAHCAIRSIRAHLVIGDGESFARRASPHFDFILDDMWDHEGSRPRAALTSPDWLGVLRSRLTRHGVCAVNAVRVQRGPTQLSSAPQADARELRVRDGSPHARVARHRLGGHAGTDWRRSTRRAFDALRPHARRCLSRVEFGKC